MARLRLGCFAMIFSLHFVESCPGNDVFAQQIQLGAIRVPVDDFLRTGVPDAGSVLS
jgi:hypothetical protein